MIPVCRPDLSAGDVQAVAEIVGSTFVAGGPEIAKFELEVATRCHRRYGIAVTNGTSALVLAVRALNLPPGSRILIPSLTIVSSLYAVVSNGHLPVFVDVNEETWNVEISDIRRIARDGLAAAIIVETYSSAPSMREISKLLKQERIPMIEDAAEGFGGSEDGQPFGSFGDISILSFYVNKLITTGEGGMVLTDDPDVCERLRSLRNLFFDRDRRFIHAEYSGNYRMSNLQAALGLSQLQRIDNFYAHRRHLYRLYLSLFSELEPFIQTQLIPLNIESSYWVFPIVLREGVGYEAADFIKLLKNHGVEARHFFYPLDRQPCLGAGASQQSEVSYKVWTRGLYLPLGNGITEEEARTAAHVVRELLARSYSRPTP
jgi:perosamine synthetase